MEDRTVVVFHALAACPGTGTRLWLAVLLRLNVCGLGKGQVLMPTKLTASHCHQNSTDLSGLQHEKPNPERSGQRSWLFQPWTPR